MTYKLIDAEERNETTPDTFWIPTLETRQSVEIGQWVKLIFKSKEGIERMWVKVTNVEGNLAGTLDNDPVFLPIKHGDMIDFEHKHITDILNDDEKQ